MKRLGLLTLIFWLLMNTVVYAQAVPRTNPPVVRPQTTVVLWPNTPVVHQTPHVEIRTVWYTNFFLYNTPYYVYPAAAVHLNITPKDAYVFVNGSYEGRVDDFDSAWQALRLPVRSLPYHIVVRRPGLGQCTFDFTVVSTHARTLTCHLQ